jgi:hypothetical protein
MMKKLASAFAALSLLCSCVHQWPVSEPADVVLTLTFDTDMPYYKSLMFPDETKSTPDYVDHLGQDFSDHENYDIRYTIEAYQLLGNGSYSREASRRWVFTEDDASVLDDYTVTLSIDEGEYDFRAWVDFVPQGTKEDYFYKTNDWKEGIKVNRESGHYGNSDWRDAFSGKTPLEVIRYGSIAEPTSGVIQMSRPLGKYVFVTNDLDDFVTKVLRTKADEAAKVGDTTVPEFNIEDYTLVIAYTGFMPSSYSMVTDRANDSDVNVRFSSKLTQVDENTAIMGFDYVLANPATATQTNVIMGIELQDKDGTVLASHASVRVPLNRSEFTVIEGRFLMQESSGGITLNPDFEGEFIVPVN